MATLEELIVRIEADVAGLKKGLVEAERVTRSSSSRMGSSFGSLNKSLATVRRSVFNLKTALAGVGAGLVAREIVQLADRYTNLQSKLRIVTTGSANLAAVQQELFRVAQSTRTSFEGTVQLYARVARSTRDLGKSQQELIDFTETVSQAIQISGATATEAEAGVIQLSQGLQSGALRGDELRSVMEQMPRLFQAIADGAGVSAGELRQMGADGKISADLVINALKDQAGTIDEEFGKVRRTVGQSMQQVQNDLLRVIGEINNSTDATSGLNEAFDDLREIVNSPAFKTGIEAILIGIAEAAKFAAGAVAEMGKTLALLGVVDAPVSIAPRLGDTSEVEGMIEDLRDLEFELEKLREKRSKFDGLLGDVVGFVDLDVSNRALEAAKRDADAAIEATKARIVDLQAAIQEARGGAPAGGGLTGPSGAGVASPVAAASPVAVQTTDELAEALAALRRELLPTVVAFEDYRAKLDLLSAAFDAGKLTLQEFQELQGELNRQFGEATQKIDETTVAVGELDGTVIEASDNMETLRSVGSRAGNAIGSALERAILQGESLKDVLSGLLSTLASVVFQAGVTGPLSAALSGAFAGAGGAAVTAAGGGFITGPGTSTSDSIPAWLSSGEFVVNAAATRQNLDLLRAINSGGTAAQQFARGGYVRRYADGGMVEGDSMSFGGTRQVINVNLTQAPGQPQPRTDPVQVAAAVGRAIRVASERGIAG